MDPISLVNTHISSREFAITDIRSYAHRLNCVSELRSSISSPLEQSLAVVETAIQEQGLKAVLTTIFDVTGNLTYRGPSNTGPFPTLYPNDELGQALADIRNHLVIELRGSTEKLQKSVTAYVHRYGFDALLARLEDPYYAAKETIKWGDAFVAAGILTLRAPSSQPARTQNLRRAYKDAQSDLLAAHAEQTGVHGLINSINEERLPFGEKGRVSTLIRKGVLSVNYAALGGGR